MSETSLEELIARACDPRVGDRIVGPGSAHVTEVTAIILLGGSDYQGAHQDTSIQYTLTGSKAENTMFLSHYQWMARVAIECGETFHAVEDDEE